jgi:methyl-accepting chemotaxis protein
MITMKLRTKILGGFGILLAGTLVLSGVSIFVMRSVGKEARILSDQNMPQTSIASEVERFVLNAVSEMRAYDFSYEESFLASSRKELAQVKANLQEAVLLTEKYPELRVLKENADKASLRVREFEALVDEMAKAGKEIHSLREKLETAAQSFTKTCLEFLDDQGEDMEKGLGSGGNPGELGGLLKRIRTMEEIIQLCYNIQLETAKGQLLRDPKAIEESAKKFTLMENDLNAIQKATTKDATVSQLEDIRMAAANYKSNMKKMVASYTLLSDLGHKRKAAGDAVSALAKEIAVSGIGETTRSAVHLEQLLSSSSRIQLAGAILGLLAGLVISLLITRSIIRPLGRIIQGLEEGADNVTQASQQGSVSSQSLAEGASEQAASIEETSSSLEEMSSMTKKNAENADQADEMMKESFNVVHNANESMKKLTVSMEEIARASEETSKIVKTIDEIAFQTNLLALNAAVEAARAGEAGAGFAVVAGEVRTLAMRAAEAAKNTANLIDGTVKKVKDGSGLVTKTNDAFVKVAATSNKVAGLVAEIAAASREQSQGIEQLNKAIADMDRVVQQNAAHSEENASASEELNGQAEQMKAHVAVLISMVTGCATVSGPGGNGVPKGRTARDESGPALDVLEDDVGGDRVMAEAVSKPLPYPRGRDRLQIEDNTSGAA